MRTRTITVFLLGLVALTCAGCAGSRAQEAEKPRRVTKLAGAYHQFPWFENELAFACLRKAIAADEDTKGRRYPEKDFDTISWYRLPSQDALPGGASIFRAHAAERVILETYRMDVAVNVFVVPGKEPVWLPEGIPSKGGIEDRYDVYDLGRPHELLVVDEGIANQLGGSLCLILWDVRENRVKLLGGWYGDEEGCDFSHEMRSGDAGIQLVIHGIFPRKLTNPAFDAQRVKLEKELGISVKLMGDGNYDSHWKWRGIRNV